MVDLFEDDLMECILMKLLFTQKKRKKRERYGHLLYLFLWSLFLIFDF